MNSAGVTKLSKLPLGGLLKHTDVALACGVIGMLMVLVVPLPPFILDVLLSIQLMFSISILLGAIYCNEPMEFSGFPSLLLLITLARLSLNVASSRLILLRGDAGHVISAFGTFVVGGNYVVGMTVFLILMVIQFVVITKGSGRVAEVAARFTLDAMPGKQMAIDADLNAGLIDEAQARARRSKIEREAGFYGAMDGSSKFVRGDAIAALIITAVNLLGGLAIGVIQRGMGIGDALRQFALLSIGDGVATQIPALLVSTAAGILVTRGASGSGLGSEVGQQLLAKPRALKITAVFLGVFGLIPGFPTLVLVTLGVCAWLLASAVERAQAAAPAAALAQGGLGPKGAGALGKKTDSAQSATQNKLLELELGRRLLPFADQNGELLTRVTQIRKKLEAELGIVIPALHVRDNLDLPHNGYRLKARGAVIAQHEIQPDKLLAINPGAARGGLEGTPTTDPAFGLPALWITTAQQGRAETYGYTVVQPVAALITHLQEALKNSAAELLTRLDVNDALERVKESDPALVKDTIPGAVTVAVLHRVLQGLLRERIPINDMVSILETLGDQAGQSKTVDALVEETRAALAPSFVGAMLDNAGVLHALACEPQLESRMIQSLVRIENVPMLALNPQHVTAFVTRAAELSAASEKKRGRKPALVCSANLRPHIRRLMERSLPGMAVLSYPEIPRQASLEIVGQLSAGVLMQEETTGVAAAPQSAGKR